MYNGGLKAYFRLSGRRRSCITLLTGQCAQKDWFLPVQLSSSDNFSNKTVRDGMFGIRMVPKEILSCLFNPFNLKILDLHLET